MQRYSNMMCQPGIMKKSTSIFILLSIILYSCSKPKDQSELPELRVYSGYFGASYGDTTILNLSGVGHLNQVTILKAPRHSVYTGFSKDELGGLTYLYAPNANFKGTDTAMFRSIEPTLNHTIISTYFIKIRP